MIGSTAMARFATIISIITPRASLVREWDEVSTSPVERSYTRVQVDRAVPVVATSCSTTCDARAQSRILYIALTGAIIIAVTVKTSDSRAASLIETATSDS